MNRGSEWHTDSLASRAACFNEAPIHESGKFCHCSFTFTGLYRFNEAPIHESGK